MPKLLDKPSDDQLRKWFFEDRLSTTEVAALSGVKRQTIWVWKKQLNIPVGFPPPPFTRGELARCYYSLGETQAEIGDRYGKDQVYVSHWMRKWGLPVMDEDERNEIVCPVLLTEEQDDVIRGTLFGDGHLRRYSGSGSGKNSWWTTEHGDKQRVYLQHLADKLHNYIARPPHRYWREDSRVRAGGCWTNFIRVRAHRFWTTARDIWYPSEVKIVPVSELDKLNARSLAYLYADDGSRAGMASNIYTLSFTRQDNDLLVDCFRTKFGFKSDVKRFDKKDQYYIHIDRLETGKFMEVIRPYLVDLEDIKRKLAPEVRAKI